MKGDEVDDVNTTDLEFADDNYNYKEVSYEFLEHNRINLARAFLGMDGGYSIRKLKKFLLNDRKHAKEESEAARKRYETEQDDGAETQEAAPIQEETAYSDESDLDATLDEMDEETFQKLVDEANSREFKNEEEAKVFFEGKLQEFSRMRLKKRKVVVDERENNDPYYAMMKQEKQISSRYAN